MISDVEKSGFEVIVHRTGGEAFNEYDVKHTEAGEGTPSVSSCWLESEQDATFTIKTTIAPHIVRRHAKYDWVVKVSVDGRPVAANILRRTATVLERSTSHMTFEEAGVKYDGLLKFAALQTTDKDDEVTLTGAALQCLGKIRVEFFRGSAGAEIAPDPRVIAPDVGIAAEKSKKLGGGIGYAQKSAHRPVKTCSFDYHDVSESPLHRMEFNYRPRTVLQLHGIIENDAPLPRAVTPLEPIAQRAGPSRKRKAEVIDIDADEDESDVKPDNKERIATRLSWLERQLQNANNLLKRRKLITPADMDIVDLTGDD